MADHYVIAVVCTDRGRHKRVRISTVRWWMLEGVEHHGMRDPLRHWAPPDPEAEPGGAISRDSYTFTCPYCTRNPSVKASTWWQLMDDTRAEGRDNFDLSGLRF